MAEFSHAVGGKGIWVREITNLNFYLLRSHLHDSSLQFVLLERLDGLLNPNLVRRTYLLWSREY